MISLVLEDGSRKHRLNTKLMQNKELVDLENNKMLRSENIEYNSDSLKDTLDKIIESGSNANGNYIKYSNGTMICTKKVSFTSLQFTSAWGNVYEASPVDLGDYAEEFSEIPLVFITAAQSTATPEGFGNTKTSFGTMTFYRPLKTTADYTYTFYLMAIGKWK